MAREVDGPGRDDCPGGGRRLERFELRATTTRPATAQVAHGTASVACAGSLDKLYKDTLGPAFKRATGDTAGGPPCAGSLALAQDILSHEINPGVFLAVGAHAIKELFPAKRAEFAMAVVSNPLVIAYSPTHSRYRNQLNAIWLHKKPLADVFKLFNTPGFKLGRTDPTQDPQGIFFILMSKLAQRYLHLPAGEAAQALGITKSSPFGSKSQSTTRTPCPSTSRTEPSTPEVSTCPRPGSTGCATSACRPSSASATPGSRATTPR